MSCVSIKTKAGWFQMKGKNNKREKDKFMKAAAAAAAA